MTCLELITRTSLSESELWLRALGWPGNQTTSLKMFFADCLKANIDLRPLMTLLETLVALNSEQIALSATLSDKARMFPEGMAKQETLILIGLLRGAEFSTDTILTETKVTQSLMRRESLPSV